MFKNKAGNYRLKIAFDFDDTLTNPVVFEFARHLIHTGHDVWILTVRSEKTDESYKKWCEQHGIDIESRPNPNRDLLDAAAELGITDKILYADTVEKSEIYFRENFDLLFDDDADWHCNPICEAGGVAVQV
ncbi:MAG: hypothetical protein LBS25_09320 [Candidatus Symbiothrix sp.]|jgi:hypothetical protein|nr:hypothetical protein [Candidatus Symbiothrix sp.]